MKFTRAILLSMLVFCAFHLADAQTPAEKVERGNAGDAIGGSRIDSKFSLFDPSRLSMQQSYSISYMSTGGHGQTIGLYLNSMKYEFSRSLTLNAALGWVHRPSTLFARDNRGISDYGSVLPNFQLIYRPSDKFLFQIGYESIPWVYSVYHRGLGWTIR